MLNERGMWNLVEAICVLAAKDYRRTKGNELDARLFFQSQWFGTLTCGADGKLFLEKLDAELEEKLRGKQRVRRRIRIDAK